MTSRRFEYRICGIGGGLEVEQKQLFEASSSLRLLPRRKCCIVVCCLNGFLVDTLSATVPRRSGVRTRASGRTGRRLCRNWSHVEASTKICNSGIECPLNHGIKL